jgi:hypothetical protein
MVEAPTSAAAVMLREIADHIHERAGEVGVVMPILE